MTYRLGDAVLRRSPNPEDDPCAVGHVCKIYTGKYVEVAWPRRDGKPGVRHLRILTAALIPYSDEELERRLK